MCRTALSTAACSRRTYQASTGHPSGMNWVRTSSSRSRRRGGKKWVTDSKVRLINIPIGWTLVTAEGQKFMLKQCAIYVGFEDGGMAQTAWTPPTENAPAKEKE